MNYDKLLSKRAQEVKPSGIRKFFGMVSKGDNTLLSLGVGEPDFDTPYAAKEQAIAAIRRNCTHYTANAGLGGLKEAICRYYAQRFCVDYKEDEVLVTVGASEAIDLACRILVDPDDEVIIPSPSYVSYAPCVRLCGGVPVEVPCLAKDQFKITPENLKKAITAKTKAIILPYPNNPTGAVMSKQDLTEIAKIIVENDLAAISDEIYNELFYSDEQFCSVASLPNMKERTIVINGFSKAFAMTGWRVGYVLAPERLTSAMTLVHQHSAICASTISQYAALGALNQGFEDNFSSVAEMTLEYNKRRLLVAHRLDVLKLPYVMSLGAFYFFPDVSGLGMDGETFALRLIKEKQVVVIPGGAFGEAGKNHVRISYAYSFEVLTKAFDRIDAFVSSLKENG